MGRVVSALVSVALVLLVAVQPVAAATSYKTFVAHVNSATKSIDGVWDEIVADAAASDTEQLEIDAGRGERRAIAELNWMKAHPPTSCYRVLHTKIKGYWQFTRDAFRELGEYVRTGDEAHLDASNAAVNELNSRIAYYNRVYRRTRC